MSEAKQLPTREELAPELTWDLTTIFKEDQEFLTQLEKLKEELKAVTSLKGTLGNGPDAFQKAIAFQLDFFNQFETLYVYAHLKNDQDTNNTVYQGIYAQISAFAAQVSEAFAWFEPELLALPEATVWDYFTQKPELEIYRHFIEQLLKAKEHVLSDKEEALLAGASELFEAPSHTFSIMNNADLKFPVVKDEQGEAVQLSHGLYGQLLESTDRSVREEAFKGMYTVYEQFKNTFAATLSSHVKMHNFKAKVRHFDSARQAALASNDIPEAVYDTLLEVVNRNLPLLHRYVALRKKLLQVDELHVYDLYTPILGEAPIKYTYEEAKAKALEALKPLGADYHKIVEEAFDKRWVDVVENQGKRSGAYSSGAYETAPYILMNWRDSLDQLYTLVHEMGHSVHSYLTRKNQPYVYGDYSIFLAEIASTTNENILTEHLLETEKDPKVRAYILNHYLDGFKGTIFRQTQFAEFEHYVHTQDAAGQPLTSEFLVNYYGELNAKYYGPDLASDREIAFEWSRIPHFYYNYYVYQYSTGFSAASALAERIVKQEAGALDKYLTFLKSGSSDYPIEVMKKAGVDMTEPTYIEDAMKVFEARLSELEALVQTL